MSGPAKFWWFAILLAVAAVFALRGGDFGVVREPGRLAIGDVAPPPPTPLLGSASSTSVGADVAGNSSAPAPLAIADAVTSIQRRGPVVAIFFAPGCSISERTVRQLARLAREEAVGISFVGYTPESDSDSEQLSDFLAASRVDFEIALLEDWAPGEFKGAIRRLGVVIPDPWTRPLVLVVGEDGRALAAWDGMRGVDELAETLRDAGWIHGG